VSAPEGRPGDAARVYHALTSYTPERTWDRPVDDPRVVHDVTPNDVSQRPSQVKRYPDDMPRTALPSDLPQPGVAATDVLAGTACVDPGRLDLPALARLLFLSAGVVRVAHLEDRPDLYFRAAGSAGGRFPLELYVAARGVPGLADAVYAYDPLAHALVRIGPAARDGVTTLVVTGVQWRTSWRYSERGYRHVHWDAGTMLAQTEALAASAGLPFRLHLRFPDADVTALVGADGVDEYPVALVALGAGAPATQAGGPVVAGVPDPTTREFPLVTATRAASTTTELGLSEPAAPSLDGVPVPASASLDDVVLRRGSTRRMDRTATLPRATLEFAVAAAVRGIGDPQFVAVHGVDGVAPGLYRWPDLATPLREGDLREELVRLCVYQDLGGDAAFVVLSCADLRGLDDRGYRAAQLRAGLVEGRLHLAAYALGAGASGMTFYDSEIAPFTGEPVEAMIFTCVGVPEYANRPGGRPGEPVAVRAVASRFRDEPAAS
jgi:SagB-type dehydrogenase family enzyme